jgi:hypothetical protein
MVWVGVWGGACVGIWVVSMAIVAFCVASRRAV